MSSTQDDARPNTFKPDFIGSTAAEPPHLQSTIDSLALIPHIEGGYFAVTDVAEATMPSPYPATPLSDHTVAMAGGLAAGFDPALRQMSSTIFYFLTPNRPRGSFHANRSRIVHTLHRGRGRYVLIHPGGRVESFVVGQDIEKGERLQWIVEGGVWKASYLLNGSDVGLLISETVVPGFEYADHEFLSEKRLGEVTSADQAEELRWLVRND